MRTQRGFTLAELIIVLVIAGTLVAMGAPRMFDGDGFSSTGTRNFVSASLRHAQKSAIAMRRNVCVAIAPSQLDVTYATVAGSDQACSGNRLVNPGNGKPYNDTSNALPARTPVTASANLIFDAQGRLLSAPAAPSNTAITVMVNGNATPITIEPGTGLVH